MSIKQVLNEVFLLILYSAAFGVICFSILGITQFISDYGDKKAYMLPKEGNVRIVYPNGESADWPRQQVMLGRK